MVAIRPRGAAPLFRRIAETLADAIGRGDYLVGAELPSEFALMRMFGASRSTICEALAELRGRGLVASRRGSGTVVLRAASPKPVFGEAYHSIDDFLASVAGAPFEPLLITDVVTDAALAAQLGCGEGRQFLSVRGIRRRRDRPAEPPLALVQGYIDAMYGTIRPHLATLTESVAVTAEKLFGIRIQRIVQESEPALLEPDEAVSLVAPPGGPALLVRRWYYLEAAEPVIISRSLYPKGRLVHRVELRRTG